MNYKEALKKIIDEGNDEALSSKEALESALGEYGLTKEEIEQAMSEFDGFPLDDDDLMMISGGLGIPVPYKPDI